MKRLWKIALVAVFALVLAIPMALTGCGTEKFTINFETEGIAQARQGGEFSVVPEAHYGDVDVEKIKDVKQGSKFSVNGNTLTIGGQTVTATPINSSSATDGFVYEFDKWKVVSFDGKASEDIKTKKVSSNLIVKAVFKKVDAVYTVRFDANGVDVGQELPTIRVTYGNSIAAENLPQVHVEGYALKQSFSNSGDLNYTGWSLDRNAEKASDTISTATALRPALLIASYASAKKTVAVTAETWDDTKVYYYKPNPSVEEYVRVYEYDSSITEYYEDKHPNFQPTVDYVNKIITLYACWSQYDQSSYYLNVRLYKVTGYRTDKTKVNVNYDSYDENLRIRLQVVGLDESLQSDTYAGYSHTEGSDLHKFGALDLYKEDGVTTKQYKVFVETAEGSGEFVDTGVTIAPTYNISNGSMANCNGYVYFTKLNIDATEGIESVTGYDADKYYLAGTQLTLTAHVASGYTFNGWKVKSLKSVRPSESSPYNLEERWEDFTGSTGEEVTITIPTSYKSGSGEKLTTIYYQVSATA